MTDPTEITRYFPPGRPLLAPDDWWVGVEETGAVVLRDCRGSSDTSHCTCSAMEAPESPSTS